MFTFLNDAWGSASAPVRNTSSNQMEAAGFQLHGSSAGHAPQPHVPQPHAPQHDLQQYHAAAPGHGMQAGPSPHDMQMAGHIPVPQHPQVGQPRQVLHDPMAQEQQRRARLQQPANARPSHESPENLKRVIAALQQKLVQFQTHFKEQQRAVMSGKKCTACEHDPNTDRGLKIAVGVLVALFVVIVVVLIVICNKMYQRPPPMSALSQRPALS